MSRQIGFGIIGLGVIAETHFVAIDKNDNCKFVGAFDMVPGKAEAFCEKHGMGKAYTDLEAFLSDPEIEVVTIATPSGYHLDPALAAISHKKHVIIEKPMEITPERESQILSAAKENGVIATGVFQSRFYEAPILIKKAIEEGRFGRLTLVDAQVKWFRSQEYYDSGAWRGTWKVDGGGALMNQSIHAIDLLQWFCGKAEEVQSYTATLSHERIEVEDTGVAVVKFQN
ncbi:MAG: Gfo/Idh/MocA family protein, partial [Candidatus Ornithospirochaeta sp.]